MDIALRSIGTVKAGGSFAVKLDPEYAAGLTGFEGFSYAVVLWYADKSPAWDGTWLRVDKPYRSMTGTLGIFATRSPIRPNPICMSVAPVASVDPETGTLGLYYIDAQDGTPVLDVKPYHPSSDRLRDVSVPQWCAHWPKYFEDSGEFAWDEEFDF